MHPEGFSSNLFALDFKNNSEYTINRHTNIFWITDSFFFIEALSTEKITGQNSNSRQGIMIFFRY